MGCAGGRSRWSPWFGIVLNWWESGGTTGQAGWLADDLTREMGGSMAQRWRWPTDRWGHRLTA